jgi:hypothetical protein
VTDIARIVEKFTMQLDGPPPGRDAWFLDYVLRSPKQAGRHLTAGWLALESVKSFDDNMGFVQEFFGGMGAQALMVQDLFHPTVHVVQEYSWDAVKHLERVLPYPHGVDVKHADAYNPDESDWHIVEPDLQPDLVVLDFGDLTVWKTREGERHRGLLDRVFARDPKAVVLTDIACRYLHLHRSRYETLLGEGTCETYVGYLYALCSRLEALYGYRLHRGWYDRWSTVMALVPDTHGECSLYETPDSPVGIEIF